MGPVISVYLAENIADMVLNGLLIDLQDGGDLLI